MITTPPSARSALDGLDLLARVALGQDPVDPERGADRLGHVRVVAGHHHDPSDAGTAKRPDHARRVGADRIVDHQRAGDLAVDRRRTRTRSPRASSADGRRGRARATARRRRRTTPSRARPAARRPTPAIPAPYCSSTSVGERQLLSRAPARRRTIAVASTCGETWSSDAASRSSSSGVTVAEGLDVGDLRDARRERAGLVEQQDRRRARASRARHRPSR